MKQMDKKVAFLLTDGFEDSEMQNPYEAITKNGSEGVIISLNKGTTLRGKKGTIEYTSHQSINDVNPEDYDAVIIPGGKSPAGLMNSQSVLEFVKAADQQGTTIAAICHGPLILERAGLLKGRTVTAYPDLSEEMKQAGANFKDKEVVIDGNLITSRTPKDEPAFIQAIIDQIGVSAY